MTLLMTNCRFHFGIHSQWPETIKEHTKLVKYSILHCQEPNPGSLTNFLFTTFQTCGIKHYPYLMLAFLEDASRDQLSLNILENTCPLSRVKIRDVLIAKSYKSGNSVKDYCLVQYTRWWSQIYVFFSLYLLSSQSLSCLNP